jgi:halocyanin-like protein
MTAAAGTAAAGAAAGTAAAQQEAPDYGPYLNDANLYSEGEFADHRGDEQVTVAVGAGPDGVSFDPPTIWIDPGTTVTWEWTGEGGGHNVVTEEGPAGFGHSDVVSEAGYTYEYEFTEEDVGITTYKCIPHESLGMKGGVAVGEDVETIEVGGGDGGDEGPPIQIPDNVYSLTMATFLVLVTTLGLGYFFMKYGGDYEAE